VTYTEPPVPVMGTGAIAGGALTLSGSAKEAFKGGAAMTALSGALAAQGKQRFAGVGTLATGPPVIASVGEVAGGAIITGSENNMAAAISLVIQR
jgi:hypothetical protein